VSNTRFIVPAKQTKSIDWTQKKKGMIKDVPRHEEYRNLDWTSQSFLSDIPDEILANTLDSFRQRHGVKRQKSDDDESDKGPQIRTKHTKYGIEPFLRFTDGEMQAFRMQRYPFEKRVQQEISKGGKGEHSSEFGSESAVLDEDWSQPGKTYTAREEYFNGAIPKHAQQMAYLRAWRKNTIRERMEDDLEVKLPNGEVVSYQEYQKMTNSGVTDTQRHPLFQQRYMSPEVAAQVAAVRSRVKGGRGKRFASRSPDDPNADEEQEGADKESYIQQSYASHGQNDLINRWFPDLDLNPDKRQHLTMEMLASIGDGELVRPRLDKWGRAHSQGQRKRAFAEAWVYPGDGQIIVNGKHYAHYFGHATDRLNVSLPLLVCDVQRQVNVVTCVKGGGPSGRAGAVRLAIAKALAKYKPDFMPMLDAYRLCAADYRQRERKKPGKPRARKSKQWKKR
jgi:small subunit ribosomal protein S9